MQYKYCKNILVLKAKLVLWCNRRFFENWDIVNLILLQCIILKDVVKLTFKRESYASFYNKNM